MISEADILLLHEFCVLDYGGAEGIRDHGLLQSVIARPFQTFDGKDLYQTPFEKAASLAESIIVNHPFVDGNKRTGLLAMLSLLKEYNIELNCSEAELYDFIISISTGEKNHAQIVKWLQKVEKFTP